MDPRICLSGNQGGDKHMNYYYKGMTSREDKHKDFFVIFRMVDINPWIGKIFEECDFAK